MWQLSYQRAFKKRLFKISEFLCSHFNIEDERKKATVFSMLCFIISRKVKTQLKCKKNFVQCVEKVPWLIERVRSGLQSFVLEISLDDAPRSGRPVEVDSDQIETLIEKNQRYRTSLVVQWLRIHLPMQGTRVRALVQEDPTCHGATKPVRHNYWACALDAASHNYRAHVPQLLKPAHLVRALQQEKPP